MEVDRDVAGYGGEYAHVRQPPHDVEAERAVLAALLRDNSKYDEMDPKLEKEDFYSRSHMAIYAQIKRLRGEKGKAADVVTVVSALADAGDLDMVGGKEYIIDLDALADITANFIDYVQLVRDKSTLRSLLSETEKIRGSASDPGENSCGEILDEAERLVFGISDKYHNNRRDSIQRIREQIEPIKIRIEALAKKIEEGERPILGLSTGFSRLDLMTSGLQDSDLIILAARPSLGKTAFALDLLRNICKEDSNAGCALFSLEMSTDQITQRMIGMDARIDQHKLRTGRVFHSKEWVGFAKAADELKKWPLWVDDTAMLSVLELRSKVRRIKRVMQDEGSELRLVVVDYLQLMEPDSQGRDDNRVAEVSKISRGLKTLARELKVPIVALSQLSRAIENRAVQRPQLSDLRESGAIEQDADLILFLARKAKPDDSYGRGSQPIEIELIIGKQRNGPTGSIDYEFSREVTRFKEMADPSGYDPTDPAPRRADRGELDDYQFSS